MGLVVLALAAALFGCGPASPLAGTDRFELSVKRALDAQLDRGGRSRMRWTCGVSALAARSNATPTWSSTPASSGSATEAD
jgi:hypothetical protein